MLVLQISNSMRNADRTLSPEAKGGCVGSALSATREYTAWTKVRLLLPLRKKVLNF